MMLTGISGSKHWRSTSITSSGLTVESGATWVVGVKAVSLIQSPGAPVKSKISWGNLQGKAGVFPGLRPSAEAHHIVDAERHRHLRGDRGALTDGAHEDRAVAEFLGAGVGENRVEHDVARPGHVALLPFPILADVDHLIAFVDQLANVVDLQIAKRCHLVAH